MTAYYDLNVNLEEVIHFLEVAQKAPEMTEQEAMIAMRAAVGMVERQVVPRTPVNTGALRGAWSTQVSRGVAAVKGEVMNPLSYAIVVEKGRKAGSRMPPKWPIVYWLRRKHGMSLEQAIEASYPVARAIARRGIKGKHMLEEGLKAAEPGIMNLFSAIPEKVFNRLA